MNPITVRPIGIVRHTEDGFVLELAREYAPALQALEGFSHINVLWWSHECDQEEARGILEVEAPYKNSPEIMGIFATRSPMRPNPISLTACPVIHVDHDAGRILLAYIDADDGTPVLDIKPYTPSIDRVEEPEVPDWCSHWPKSMEESGDFDWSEVFNF